MTAAEFRAQHKGHDSERDLQRAVCEWLDVQGIPCFAVPNGQMRSGQAMEPGLKKGVPDLCIPIKTKTYGSLWVELKQPNEYTRKAQRTWLDRLTDLGHACRVCRSVDEVEDVVRAYRADRIEAEKLWPHQR